MTRPRRLERRLEAALAPVVDRLDTIDESIACGLTHASELAYSKIASAEQRVTAATAQADERVIKAHADLAEARRQTIDGSIARLVSERDEALALAERLTIERDAAREAHDEMRVKMHEATDSCNANLVYIGRLTEASRAVLGDLHTALRHRSAGGSKTRARHRLEALEALLGLEPVDD